MVSKSNQKFKMGRAYRELCMNIAEARANITMFNSMIRMKIATNDIRQFSLKQAAQCRVYKGPNLRLEKSAMRNKRKDLIAHVKRMQQEKYRVKKSLISLYNDRDLKKIGQVIRRINHGASNLMKKLKHDKKHKIAFISAKYQQNKKDDQAKSLDKCLAPVRNILMDLEVFNREIKAEPPGGPLICHPDISLSKHERAILNKGPKYMIRKPVTRSEFRREVEKSIAKQNYNEAFQSVSDPDVTLSHEENKQILMLETECKMVYNPRENNLSLSRLKATDFKYNKICFKFYDYDSQNFVKFIFTVV